MDPKLTQKLEKANYRKVNEGELSCIHCNHSDNNLNISRGRITSKCYFFQMNVDESHICDLIK